MARGRRRQVEMTSKNIQVMIDDIDNKITSMNDEIKSLRNQKKELIKDLAAAQKKEAEEQEAENMKALALMMKEKNISISDLKQMITSK